MRWLLVLVAAPVTLAGAPVAFGVVAGSHVSIHADPPAFSGRVSAEDYPICKRHRKVVLYKVRPGHDRKLDHAFTSRHGRWLIFNIHPIQKRVASQFYVKVRFRTISRKGTGFVCDRTRSRVISVG